MLDLIQGGATITILIIVSLLILYWNIMATIAKGLFAVGVNNTYGLLKSSFMMSLFSKLSKRKVPNGLPVLEEFEKVSPRVYRVLGLNPGPHTLQGTNTWLITGSNSNSLAEHILVDTGEDSTADEYVNLLFNKVFPISGTKRLSKILLTHGHGDHQGGVLRILEELKSRQMLPLPTIYKRNIKNGNFPCVGFTCEQINDLDIYKIDTTTTIQACYTPGHTDDHVGFLLHKDHAVLSGDCVLGCGTSVFDNLFQYMNSLRRIRKIIVDSNDNNRNNDNMMLYPNSIHTIYPGHGPVIRNSALEKIDEYIHHRELREEQILAVLHNGVRKGENSKNDAYIWHASWDIMCTMYGPLPSFMIQLSAMHNVSHHLEKLQQEGRIESRWPDLWRLKSTTTNTHIPAAAI